MDQGPEISLRALALSVAACIALCTTLLVVSFELQKREVSDMKTTVAQALIDPRVRSCRMYFKAKDPGAEDGAPPTLFRLYTDPAQSLLGGHTWTTLQKLVIDPRKDYSPYWWAVGGVASIDWLPEEAELVERTKEMP